MGVPVNLDFSCTDANADSLVYSLVQPIDRVGTGGGKPFQVLTYNTGYSLINILGAGSSCTINTSTGIVTGQAAMQGIYVIAVKCEEFRSGFKIGEVIREAEVPAINCTLLVVPEIIDLDNLVSIYPNPNNGEFKIEVKDKSLGNIKLEVYDVYGKRVFFDEIKNSMNTISLEGIAKGIYTVKLSTENEHLIKRIIVN